jgi:DNA-binding LacI/PurR family transcriptional regulator
MKNSAVTAQEVAKRAGVSQTTVSFVLNNVEGAAISAETQERVRKAARELGYVPHVAARTLAKGRSNNIGLVLIQPHFQVFTDPYIPNILTGVCEITQAHGFRILVEHVKATEYVPHIADMLKGGEVAGLIVNNIYGVEDVLSRLTEDHYPVVCLDAATTPDIYSVCIDHFSGVRRIVQHLIDLGRRRIACITYGPLEISEHTVRRLRVYREMLEAAGIPYDEQLVRYGAFDPETGYRAAQSLLELDNLPTAIFGMNDMMAFGAMTAVREAGLRVPDDIAVAGYDDIRTARYASPPLTTMRAPEVELGRESARMVIDLMNGIVPTEKHISLQSELIIRNSCGALKALPAT